jgi:hypothetical protein
MSAVSAPPALVELKLVKLKRAVAETATSI